MLDGLDPQRQPRKPPRKLEAPLQRAVVVALRRRLPPGSLVAAVTNHSRSKHQTFALLAQGMLPGMPDLLVFTSYHVFGIEMKAPGGRLSSAQQSTQAGLRALGVPVLAECASVQQAVAWLELQGVVFQRGIP